MKRIFSRAVFNVLMAYRLGSGFYGRLHFFFISFWIPVRKRLQFRNKPLKVYLKKFGKKFTCFVTDGSDFAVLREVFFDDQYDIELEDVPSVILDIGSNVGYSVIYFKLKYPKAKIFAVEPDPITREKLERNVIGFPDITIYAYAIDGENTVQDFYVSNLSMSSSLREREGFKHVIKVQGRSLDSFIEEIEEDVVDLIKFDVEGAEYAMFQYFKRWPIVHALIGEVHIDLIEESLENFMDLIKGYRTRIVKRSKYRYLLIAHAEKSS